jgi:hypothetical protein
MHKQLPLLWRPRKHQARGAIQLRHHTQAQAARGSSEPANTLLSAAGTLCKSHTKTQVAGRCLPAIPNNTTARAPDLPRVSRRRNKEDTGLHKRAAHYLM